MTNTPENGDMRSGERGDHLAFLSALADDERERVVRRAGDGRKASKAKDVIKSRLSRLTQTGAADASEGDHLSPPLEPQKPRYTATQMRYIAFLGKLLPPLTMGGVPIAGPKVRELARGDGLTNIEALFAAGDALRIERRRREGASANEPDLWVPPSEYPAEFDRLLTSA